MRAGRAVCVIGLTVQDALLGPSDPLGRSIRVGNVPCEVIGLLAAKGDSSLGIDQEDIVLLPLRIFQHRIAGNTDINTIDVSARDGMDTGRLQAEIERLLRERRHIARTADDDFVVRDMTQIVATMTATTALMTGLQGTVAAFAFFCCRRDQLRLCPRPPRRPARPDRGAAPRIAPVAPRSLRASRWPWLCAIPCRCPLGGTGRRKGLKIPDLRVCRFESGSGHQGDAGRGE